MFLKACSNIQVSFADSHGFGGEEYLFHGGETNPTLEGMPVDAIALGLLFYWQHVEVAAGDFKLWNRYLEG